MYASLTKSNKKRKLHSKRKGAKNIVLTKTYLKPMSEQSVLMMEQAHVWAARAL